METKSLSTNIDKTVYIRLRVEALTSGKKLSVVVETACRMWLDSLVAQREEQDRQQENKPG